MSKITRKALRPAFVAAALGVVAMLAVLAAVALPSGSAQAQGNIFAPQKPGAVTAARTAASPVTVTWGAPSGAGLPPTGYEVGRKVDGGAWGDVNPGHSGISLSYTDNNVVAGSTYQYRVRGTGAGAFNSDWVESNVVAVYAMGTATPTPMPTAMPSGVSVGGWSSSGGGGEDIVITVANQTLDIDDSFVLVLDDKFTVPGSLPMGTVFFKEPGGKSGGARVTASTSVDSEDDDTTGEDSHTIRIYVPDMDPADDAAAGITGNFGIVIAKAAGVKNPTEGEKSYAIGYQILKGTAGYDSAGTMAFDDDGSDSLSGSKTDSMVDVRAKVSLDDDKDKRGYELTITGSGFNKSSSATAYVLKGQSAAPASCAALIANDDKESLGSGTVGADHKVVITATVTGGSKGDFSPGATNYICIRDDNAPMRRLSSDVDPFNLEHSVAVEPAEAASGDEVTVKLRDYPAAATIDSISLDGKKSLAMGDAPSTTMFEKDGSDLIFEMPGGVSGTVEVAVVATGATTKTTTITVNPASLDLSLTEVAPNASIIISGSGFNEGAMIPVGDITMDDEPLVVDDAGTVSCASGECVKVTSSGEFTATVRVWTASSSNKNPALDDGEYTIKVKDEHGFEGKAKITILEPTVMVTPDTASPRDFIVISGENWPISTADDDYSVTIEVDGRTRSADTDGTGRFRYEYQLRANIKIGDEQDVKVSIADMVGSLKRDDIEEETTFNVTQAELGIMPAAAAPGQMISVEIEGMRPYTLVDKINIGRVSLLGNQSVTTDREGDATVSDLIVPYLDPGHYPVEVMVGSETRVAQFEVLSEAIVPGVAAMLPGAVSDLGDNLEAVFHFNNTSKEWSFYDPRPEFADLNTLTELNGGQPYWVLVKDSQEDVDWNGRLVSFTCAASDCWNLEIW